MSTGQQPARDSLGIEVEHLQLDLNSNDQTRLDLNLDVDIYIRARVHGDVTLTSASTNNCCNSVVLQQLISPFVR